jgi:phosphohistidine phosphatase SixA
MPRIKLFLMRHSKSCSNHVRELAETEDWEDPVVKIAKAIRDPGLSVIGRRMASTYGPRLCQRLEAAGFECSKAFIASSGLRRAKETARLVFGRDPTTVRYFKENGNIPENTPRGERHTTPHWASFLRHLSTLVTDDKHVAVVGHGSFLANQVWPSITGGKKHAGRFHNLDGVLIEGEFEGGRLRVDSVREFKYDGAVKPTVDDKCAAPEQERFIQRKLAAHTRKMRKQQRGAGYGMPLGYYNDGAQMRGTYSDPTGAGLAGSSDSMIRAPLAQTGGRRRTLKQHGGWAPPSVMGAFLTNGAQLLPVAAYLGYKMNKSAKGRRTRKGRTGRTGRTGRGRRTHRR